jgi:prepilin-type N-terminal cleavage/methylation domain-containing protein
MSAFRKKAGSGFTLIELLVVIAIIAILAAILFPVFARARERAKVARCISHEKELATAVLTYQGDFDDCFPLCPYYAGDKHTPDNLQWPVGQFAGGKTGIYNDSDKGVPDQSERPLNRYVRSNSVFWKCPSEPKTRAGHPALEAYDYDYWGNSYPMNSHWYLSNGGVLATLPAYNAIQNGHMVYQWGRKMSSVKRPRGLILFGDRVMHTYFWDGNPNQDEGFRNHDPVEPKSVVVFCDGHAAYIRMTPDHQVSYNGVTLKTHGLWDEKQGWALMERGWVPWDMTIGSPIQ